MPEPSLPVSQVNNELEAMGLSATDEKELTIAVATDEALSAARRGELASLEALLGYRISQIMGSGALLNEVEKLEKNKPNFWVQNQLISKQKLASTRLSSNSNPLSLAPKGDGVPNPFPNEYDFKEIIGEGAFGQVWLAHNKDGKQVAIKTINRTSAKVVDKTMADLLANEFTILVRVRDEYIVPVISFLTSTEGQPYLVMEYISGGSLLDRLNQQGTSFSWQVACPWIVDVGFALLELQRLGLHHCDVKPANILLDEISNKARLIDFGLATENAFSRGCSQAYSPLEAWKGHVSEASELYTLAASLFHLITNQPLKHPDDHKNGLSNTDDRLDCAPQWLRDLLCQVLVPKPEDRPSLKKFLETLQEHIKTNTQL